MTEDDRRAHLAHAGLSMRWLDRLQDSAHALQAYWLKFGLELARADPYCDGYCYWTICDSVQFKKKGSVFAGQGLLDVFWQPKRCGLAPEDVAVFTQHLSGIGKLRDAHQSKYVWSSGAPYTITLHTADGSQMEYQIKDGMLQMEGSRWFWFPGYEELQDLILAYRPSNP